MSALLKLEQDFKDCMLGNRLDMRGQVVGNATASAEERVKIYVDGYRLRLLEVLEDNFEGLHTLIGDEEFDRLGRCYIDAHPSTHPSVRWFSRHLAKFLRDTPPYSADPWLAEMAAFEWAQGLAFDAADDPAMELQALAAVPPESWATLRFGFHASLQRLGLAWNVPQAWAAMDAGDAPPKLQALDASLDWLVWRQGITTRWRSLGEDEAWTLDAAREARNFAELCEGLCRWHAPEAVALQAASHLKLWLNDGLISALLQD
ncbi:MAG: DUF2063 domain-containing protein [Bacillota bacterium]